MKDAIGKDKKSFCMAFGGAEIWFEHLDGLFLHTSLAVEKLEHDYVEFKRPSMPSLLAINLEETNVNDKLIGAITEKLLHGEKRFTRVIFVGVNGAVRRKIRKLLKEAAFVFDFTNDFERAKEWLVRIV